MSKGSRPRKIKNKKQFDLNAVERDNKITALNI